MLTVDDIPEGLAGDGTSDGERLLHLAAAVETCIRDRYAGDRQEASRCIVQASNQLRSSRVGVQLFTQAHLVSDSFGEQQQFVELAGSQLAVVSAASAIDLCVAALVRLTGNQEREYSLGQIAAPRFEHVFQSLPPAHREWITATNESDDVGQLMDVRHRLVHRPISLNMREVAGEPHTTSYYVSGELVVVDPVRDYAVAVDRFISIALRLHAELGG